MFFLWQACSPLYDLTKAKEGARVLGHSRVTFFNREREHVCSHQHTPFVPENHAPGIVIGKANDCITLHCTVWEEDSVPDIGNTTVNIRLTDGATGTVRITVRENRGRFKGNTAVWVFTYSVALL